MKVALTQCTPINTSNHADLWMDVLNTCVHYSFFQTPAWTNLLCECIDGARNESLYLEFSDGVNAIMPLVSIPQKMGIRKLESLPWGCYGGLVSSTLLTEAHFLTTIEAITPLHKPLAQIFCNPLHEIPHNWPISVDVNEKESWGIRLDSYEQFWKGVQSRTRTAINKAERVGVEVTQGLKDKDINTLHELYVKANAHWEGVETLPDTFFDTLNTLPDHSAKVWTAWHNNTPLAADLMLYGKGEVQYFAGAADREHSNMQAPKLLMSRIIHDACENKFTYFNLGASAGLEGVERFKKALGAEVWKYQSLRWIHPLIKIIV